MELEQVHSDLLDLRQLYCLMQSCFSPRQNPRVEILGGRARLSFKSLLDDAAAKVFMAYSKIVETPNDSDELYFSQPEKTKNGVPKPKLIFEAPPRIVSMQTQNKSTPPMAANSGLSTTPERKQCRACARRGTMKSNPSVENNRDVSDKQDGLTHFHGDDEQRKQTRGSTESKNARESDWLRNYETEKKSRTTGNERSSSLNSFVSCSSTTHETTGYDIHRQREKKKQDTAIDYSEDISNTIKKIESHILSLKLRSRSKKHIPESGLGRPSEATESSPFRSDLLNNQVGQLSKNKTFTKSIPNQELSLRNDFGRSYSVSTASRLHGCEQELKRKGIKSLSQSANQASPPEFVHGFVVPSVPEDTGMKDLTRKTVRSHPSHYGSPSGRSRAKEEELRKNMPRQMVITPTLLNHPTTELMVLPTPIKNRRDRAPKRINQVNLPKEEETEKSQSSSSASASPSWTSTASSSLSWTSQQSGIRSTDYSSPRHYVGPVGLHRVKVSPIRRHKPDSHKVSEKMIGGLRRLKNKLGLILHHHHHHHHHHHNGDDGQLTRMDRRHSMWKHLGNLFHKAQKNRPVKKNNKSRVKKAASEDQVGHFHALAEGFMRHFCKYGRSKKSKGKIRGLRRQKKKKKLKSWKLPKKVKGFGNKKRRLKFA